MGYKLILSSAFPYSYFFQSYKTTFYHTLNACSHFEHFGMCPGGFNPFFLLFLYLLIIVSMELYFISFMAPKYF